jgi:uncharacterized protein (UPF0254 family)
MLFSSGDIYSFVISLALDERVSVSSGSFVPISSGLKKDWISMSCLECVLVSSHNA